MKAKLSAIERDLLCRRYSEGESVGALAKEFGVTHGSVGYLLRSRGIDRRPSPFHTRFDSELFDEAVRLYQTGLDALEVERRTGLSHQALYRELEKRGITRHNQHTAEQWAEIRRLYLAGVSLSELGRRFDCQYQGIAARLRKEGIVIRPTGAERRVHTCDDHFFDEMDCERKAYWLGFIAADGCVRVLDKGERILRINLQGSDAHHLATLRSDLQATNPVGFSGRGQGVFAVNSPGLVAGLARHGIAPRKSLVHRWPHTIPEHLLRHFLRGYSDGDGSLGITRDNQAVWTLCGTAEFLSECQQYLARTVAFNANALRKNGAIHMMSYGGNRQVARLAHLLYDDATVYLPRKREKVAHLL